MIHRDTLDESALLQAIGRTEAPTENIDDLGYSLAHELDDGNGLGTTNLWEQAKKEFRKLLCTDDSTYADIRKKAMETSPTYTTALIAALSAALGAALGVAAAAIAPIVGLLLLALSRVGKNAICNMSWGA